MKTFSLAWITSSLLLFEMSAIGYAQPDDLRFENLSDRRGLPKIAINTILQDHEGFMWFGTNEGLYRFDGHTATAFQHDPNNPEHSLPTNLIITIHEDRQGRFWVATPVGLLRIDKRTGIATTYRPDSTRAFGWNVIKDILEDREGILWLGTSEGLARFDPGSLKFRLYPPPTQQVHTGLNQDNAGGLWSLTFGGLCRFHPTTGKFDFYMIKTRGRQSLPFSLYIDATGIAWVGTRGEGLFRMDTRTPGRFVAYNPGGGVLKTINEIYEADGYLWLVSNGLQRINPKTNEVIDYHSGNFQSSTLSNSGVYTLYQDRLDNLWVGTTSGVNKASLRTSPFYVCRITPTPDAVMRPENAINNILEDRTGTVWLASNKKGLYRYDQSTKQMTQVTVNPADSRSTIEGQQWPLLEDRQGRLWVGTDLDKGLYVLDRITNKFTRHNSEIAIRCLAMAPSGTIWLGSPVNGIAAFDPATDTFTYYPPTEDANGIPLGTWVSAILVSRSEEVWVASLGRGVIRLNPKTGKFTQYLPRTQTKQEGLLNDFVAISLYEDEEGIIWIGTLEGGLNRLDPDTNVFTYFTSRDGLPSNAVYSITGDKRGYLWLGTTQGLSRFNHATHTCRNFDESDGLPDNFFIEGSIYYNNGKLFLGTRNGLVIFHPDSIKETLSTPVYITSLKVGEKHIPLSTDEIELSYQENFLSFDFTTINYDSPDKARYAYQLEGVDADWVYSGNRRFANFTDLSPGSYTFRVKTSTDNHAWNEAGSSIKIIIHPPWWQTWWAYGLYGLLGISVLFGLIHYNVSRERLKSDLKLQRLEAEKMHEIDHLKSRFFANISHEFRTPLTLILGPLKDHYQQLSNPDQKNVIGSVIRNGQRLQRLINQLLDLSKVEAGKMELHAFYLDLVQLLREITSSYESLAKEKKIRYFFYPEVMELMIYADEEKIEKVIHNLLSNAFKFTKEGGEIILNLKIYEKAAVISVSDSGIGISGDQLNKVFDRFYQVDSSQTRGYEGSGLGLALAKDLVELHHGKISVNSKEGKGTTLTVTLPLGKEHLRKDEIADRGETVKLESVAEDFVPSDDREVVKEAEKVREKETANENTALLIVEDNFDMRQYIRKTLSPHYQIIEAENGKDGVTKAEENMPDLVISDIMMPEMDGIAMTAKLKKDIHTSHIPIILLTAKATEESKISGLNTGADDYLVKPFNSNELILRVRNMIESRTRVREKVKLEFMRGGPPKAAISADEKLLQKVKEAILNRLSDEQLSVDSLAEEIGLSRAHFYRKVTALTGLPVNELIRSFRLERAAQLLAEQWGPVSQVAYEVGFSNPSYFSKCFKDKFGVAPSDYSAKNQRERV